MDLINLGIMLLVALIIIGLIWWGIDAIGEAYGISPKITVPVKVLFVCIAVLWLISHVLGSHRFNLG